MMHTKFITTLLIIISLVSYSYSQDVILKSQAEVDAFDPNTTIINGNLWIGEDTFSMMSDINNLSTLVNLTTVTGDVNFSRNGVLTNLDDLSNLSSIGGDLRIHGNMVLISIDGLSSLTSLDGNLYIINQNILPNIDGLSNLTYLGGDLDLRTNHALSNVNGLSNLSYIGGYFWIYYNPVLLDLDGLSSLSSIGADLRIHGNMVLTNIDGLSNLTSIENYLRIDDNLVLSNLDGLSNLAFIGNTLWISNNEALLNIGGLSNLTAIEGNLIIRYNPVLSNLDGLSNLSTIEYGIFITNNSVLSNINSLSNISFIGGDLEINDNDALSDCCGIQYVIFTEGAVGGEISIYNNPSPCSGEVDILGDDCGLNLNTITGSVFLDMDSDCLLNGTDVQRREMIVEAFSYERTFTTVADSMGNYEIYVDTGAYEIRAYPNHDYIEQTCEEFYPVEFLDPLSEFTNLDIPLEVSISCPYLEVDVSTWSLRECFDNHYTVRYCNTGTAEATGVYIELDLDGILSVADASVPFTGPNANNVYTFDIGEVGINDCEVFSVNIQLPCDTLNAGQYLGQTFCIDAHIYPDSICIPPASFWDGASTEVTSECILDSIYFRIINKGEGDMLSPKTFHVIEDQVIFYQGSYQLLAGEEMTLSYFANGSTFRLEAEQVEGHPGNSEPSVAIEACDTASPTSLGYINQFPQDDADPFVSIECREVTGSYDPNDKQAFPIGYGEEHFIEKNTDIEYLIRFQNTGTDTAFTVVVKDEISPLLDLTTISPGASSHSYTFQMTDNLVEFVFDDILLVDSLTNEEESHGFVKFRISQQSDLPNGSVIENTAGIYFDYNPAIITNTTFHTIGEDFVTIDLIDGVEDLFELTSAKAYPNPFSDVITFELDGVFEEIVLRVYDVAGREVSKKSYTSSKFQFNRKDLNNGMYFFKLSSEKIDIASGKMIVE